MVESLCPVYCRNSWWILLLPGASHAPRVGVLWQGDNGTTFPHRTVLQVETPSHIRYYLLATTPSCL